MALIVTLFACTAYKGKTSVLTQIQLDREPLYNQLASSLMHTTRNRSFLKKQKTRESVWFGLFLSQFAAEIEALSVWTTSSFLDASYMRS